MFKGMRKIREEERGLAWQPRWAVYCVGLYEGALTQEEAILEKASAERTCDCGGRHVVRLEDKV